MYTSKQQVYAKADCANRIAGRRVWNCIIGFDDGVESGGIDDNNAEIERVSSLMRRCELEDEVILQHVVGSLYYKYYLSNSGATDDSEE